MVQDRNLPSPEPAFKEPYRAKFNYFKANNEQFVALAAAKVTDQEIADYYEKNKRQFKVTPLPTQTTRSPLATRPSRPLPLLKKKLFQRAMLHRCRRRRAHDVEQSLH